MGGKIMFENKLDQLFREPLGRSKYAFGRNFRILGVWSGQYSGGNESIFYIPYLYNFTNSPWKIQKYIRLLLDI
jgi:putative alpha-1,2-mannosidase